MADVSLSQSKIGGTVLSPTAATAGPDAVEPGDRVILIVQNGDTVSITVTVTVPGSTRWGEDQPDVTSVSIPAGGIASIGPFPRELADSSTGKVSVTSSSTTSVNFYAVRA